MRTAETMFLGPHDPSNKGVIGRGKPPIPEVPALDEETPSEVSREKEPKEPLRYTRFQTGVMAPGDSRPSWTAGRKQIAVVFDESGEMKPRDGYDFEVLRPFEIKSLAEDILAGRAGEGCFISKIGDSVTFFYVGSSTEDLHPLAQHQGFEPPPIVFVKGITFSADEFNRMLQELYNRGILDEAFGNYGDMAKFLEIDAVPDNETKILRTTFGEADTGTWLSLTKANMTSVREYQKPESVLPLEIPSVEDIESAGGFIESTDVGGQLSFIAKKFDTTVKDAIRRVEGIIKEELATQQTVHDQYDGAQKKFSAARKYMGTAFDQDFLAACEGFRTALASFERSINALNEIQDKGRFCQEADKIKPGTLKQRWEFLKRVADNAYNFAVYKKQYLQEKTTK